MGMYVLYSENESAWLGSAVQCNDSVLLLLLSSSSSIDNNYRRLTGLQLFQQPFLQQRHAMISGSSSMLPLHESCWILCAQHDQSTMQSVHYNYITALPIQHTARQTAWTLTALHPSSATCTYCSAALECSE